MAGAAIAIRAAASILGTSTPCVVDCISRIEEASGVVVPIPTLFCACMLNVARKAIAQMVKIFFIARVIGVGLFRDNKNSINTPKNKSRSIVKRNGILEEKNLKINAVCLLPELVLMKAG